MIEENERAALERQGKWQLYSLLWYYPEFFDPRVVVNLLFKL